MSIDWKARCAEHCGTIGNRDATIEKLQAQLETEKQSNARWQEWSLRDQKQLEATEKNEGILAEHNKIMMKQLDAAIAHNDSKDWYRQEQENIKLQAKLDAVRLLPRHSILTGGMVEVPHGQWVNIMDIEAAIREES